MVFFPPYTNLHHFVVAVGQFVKVIILLQGPIPHLHVVFYYRFCFINFYTAEVWQHYI